jgi:hypothetical protein
MTSRAPNSEESPETTSPSGRLITPGRMVASLGVALALGVGFLVGFGARHDYPTCAPQEVIAWGDGRHEDCVRVADLTLNAEEQTEAARAELEEMREELAATRFSLRRLQAESRRVDQRQEALESEVSALSERNEALQVCISAHVDESDAWLSWANYGGSYAAVRSALGRIVELCQGV